MSFNGGYQSTIIGGSSRGGAVFITDVEPQNAADNVGGKVFSSNGKVLDSCVTSTQFIKVHILAITGFSNFKPTILVAGAIVNLIQDEDQNVWTGSIDLDLSNQTVITAIHEDGANHSISIASDDLPVIQDAKFVGLYPSGQTELKEADVFDFELSSSSNFISLEFDDFGAAKAQVFDFAAVNSKTVSIEIADRGNTLSKHGARVRIKNSNETFSEWFETASLGEQDGVNKVNLNNLQPEISIDNVSYPENQEALKDNETAVVEHTISDFDSVAYSSEEQLQINDSGTYLQNKPVQRLSGSYNVDNPNLTIAATRAANGARVELELIIKIAHTVPEISLIAPTTRLISGGNAGTEIERHNVIIDSTQELLGIPEITAPIGQLIDSMSITANPRRFEQEIAIHDNLPKGIYVFELVAAKNLAGLTINSFSNTATYEIGGFSKRILTIEAFGNEAQIGTTVSETSKLIVQDKDQIPMRYSNTLEEGLLEYTITNPSNFLNPEGNIFHWNDSQAINNNTTGLATISMEEPP